MLMAKQSPKLSAQILDEASAWFTEFTDGALDTAARAEFNTWLRRSPEHVQAYLQIAAFWEDADVLRKRLGRDFEGLIARAKQERNVYPLEWAARADTISLPAASPAPAASDRPSGLPSIPENVGHEASVTSQEIAVSPSSSLSAKPIKAPHGALRSLFALAASIVLLLTAVTWLYLQRGVYTTDIGEQRSITLDDGSSVELNARSRVRVRFNQQQRVVELMVGQALFRVAKDPGRPFVVKSGDTRVRAVGTQFDIYRKRSGTIVTVVEGRVAVAGPSAHPPSVRGDGPPATFDRNNEVLLQAGEQLTVSAVAPARAAAQPKPRRANIAVATAWTEKKLVFEGAPLREVVEEFNRYNRQQLVIRDPSLYEFHVSGVFPSTDSARMLDVLRRRFGVTLSRSGNEIEISRRTDDPNVIEPTQIF